MHPTNSKLGANAPSTWIFCGGPLTVFGLLDIMAIKSLYDFDLLPMIQSKSIMLAFEEIINENYVL